MAAEVVSLETGNKRANRHTVELLELALSEAKAGKIQECALAVVYADRSTGYRRSSTEHISLLIGSTSIMLHNLHRDAEMLTDGSE